MADVNQGNRPLSPICRFTACPLPQSPRSPASPAMRWWRASMLIVWWLPAVASPGRSPAPTGWCGPGWASSSDRLDVGAGYHLLAGVRHLFYDAGHGMEIEQAQKSSQALIAGSVGLAVLALIVFFLF